MAIDLCIKNATAVKQVNSARNGLMETGIFTTEAQSIYMYS